MFSEELWEEFATREKENYDTNGGKKIFKKKSYRHFDKKCWFPDQELIIKSIVEQGLQSYNPATKRVEHHSFSPFIKLFLKTPRYRYQHGEGHYELETKIRPICFANHTDSLIMAYYSYALTKKYEDYIRRHSFDDVVLAYRSDLGKCNIQFAREAFDIVRSKSTCSVIALDIKGYFDHIDHQLLKVKLEKLVGGRLPDDLFRLYKVLTKYTYVKKGSLLRKYYGAPMRGVQLPATYMEIVPGSSINEKFGNLKADGLIVQNKTSDSGRCYGIPQGSPMSALLSNIYLMDFDKDMKDLGIKQGFVYRRYCDDILLICDTKDAATLMNKIIKKISDEYYLTIQPEKADLVDFHLNRKGKIRGFRRKRNANDVIASTPAVFNASEEGRFYSSIQYLGFEFNGQDIFIRTSSLSRYFRKLNRGINRTVKMAYSPGSSDEKVFLKTLLKRYSHLGNRNFLTYAYNASRAFYTTSGKVQQGMDSPAIRKQLAGHMKVLMAKLEKKNIQRALMKGRRNRKVELKRI